MASRLAIYHPAGTLGLRQNPFGKDVANLQMFQALARHGGFQPLDVLSNQKPDLNLLAQQLGAPPETLGAGSIIDQGMAAAAGALLRGTPHLEDLAWLRRRTVGDRAYSLIGLVHTLAPPVLRREMAALSTAPIHPWDALICTSPSVQQALGRMFDDWGAFLAERTGGAPPPRPRLPLAPLGVDGAAFAAMADRPDARARIRAELEVGDDDLLVLWVGRLSFFEKAYPQPMFRALEDAAVATGKRVTFAMAGWYPDAGDARLYDQAAREYAPSVKVRSLDGNDRAKLADLWAGADVFLSLVDNIQETFGITPIEAMAAGLPVVVSDWDGYRYTVRDGEEGFLIPTLGGPPGGPGPAMAAPHQLLIESYQSYVGAVAQHTAVHVGRAADALARLFREPELRRRMGAAGRARVASTFDWPRVVDALKAIVDELAGIRAQASPIRSNHRLNPVKGDPFHDFAGFATEVFGGDTRLSVRAGASAADLDRAGRVDLDRTFGLRRASLAECRAAFEAIADGRARTARDILLATPEARRGPVALGLVWMCKLGVLDWMTV